MSTGFNVRMEDRNKILLYHLESSDGTTATVVPQFGNNCFSFEVGEPILEPIGFDAFVAKPTSFGIPLLFPFPNRIRDGRYSFDGKEFEVDPPRHGFVRDKAWRVEESGSSEEDGAWLKSTFDAGNFSDRALSAYPSLFQIDVTYRVRPNELSIETVWRNTGEEAMPTGFGIHPYFVRPRNGTVTVPADSRLELVDSLPTGSRLELDDSNDLRASRPVAGLELDDIYTDIIGEGIVRCSLVDNDRGIETIVEFDKANFPFVVVYTPPEPRAAICIEPNTCPTDAFNLQPTGFDANVLRLEAGDEHRADIRIRVKR